MMPDGKGNGKKAKEKGCSLLGCRFNGSAKRAVTLLKTMVRGQQK